MMTFILFLLVVNIKNCNLSVSHKIFDETKIHKGTNVTF